MHAHAFRSLLSELLLPVAGEVADIRCARGSSQVILAERPTIVLDLDAPPDRRCWDLLTGLLIAAYGPDAVAGATTVRSLRPVS